MRAGPEITKKWPKHLACTFLRSLSLFREIGFLEDEDTLLSNAIIAIILGIPARFFTVKVMQAVIKDLNPKKMAIS